MKNLSILFAILIVFFIMSCNYVSIPEAPFVVKQIESCNGCTAKYKYKIVSLNNRHRYTEILADELFAIGDTLNICN